MQKGMVIIHDQVLFCFFYSRLLLVEKERWVETCYQSMPFSTLSKVRMETVKSVQASIQKGDFMFSIGQKDTCFQIFIHPESRSFFCFMVNEKMHHFKALCFAFLQHPMSSQERRGSYQFLSLKDTVDALI